MDWQPNNTAPTTGESFISYDKYQNWYGVAWYDRVHKCWKYTGGVPLFRFSHWAPLPPPRTEGMMEQVKRFKMSNCCGEDARCQFAKEYVLAADHAHCVEDCRRMAEIARAWIHDEQIRQIAQAVLDRWPEVTNG